jgi:hypothetical protein
VRAAHAQGVGDVHVSPLQVVGTIRGMDFLSSDPADWLNVCAARYYGVRAIAADARSSRYSWDSA